MLRPLIRSRRPAAAQALRFLSLPRPAAVQALRELFPVPLPAATPARRWQWQENPRNPREFPHPTPCRLRPALLPFWAASEPASGRSQFVRWQTQARDPDESTNANPQSSRSVPVSAHGGRRAISVRPPNSPAPPRLARRSARLLPAPATAERPPERVRAPALQSIAGACNRDARRCNRRCV